MQLWILIPTQGIRSAAPVLYLQVWRFWKSHGSLVWRRVRNRTHSKMCLIYTSQNLKHTLTFKKSKRQRFPARRQSSLSMTEISRNWSLREPSSPRTFFLTQYANVDACKSLQVPKNKLCIGSLKHVSSFHPGTATQGLSGKFWRR